MSTSNNYKAPQPPKGKAPQPPKGESLNNDLNAENNDLRAENNDLKAENNDLKAENNDLKAENNDLRAENNDKTILKNSPCGGRGALSFSDLTIGYGKKILAEHLSATLMPSALTCLIGRNGVGKSTLLRTIRRQDCAIVLTGRPHVRNITVEEVVGMGRSPYTNMWGTLRDKDHVIVNESMERVGITALAHRDIATLSDGECQKVMIAKALAQQTDIILLDEPTAFLDYPSKLEMVQMLHDIAHERGCAILLSTHDLDMSLSRADQVWLITRSHELKTGTPDELSEQIDSELKVTSNLYYSWGS